MVAVFYLLFFFLFFFFLPRRATTRLTFLSFPLFSSLFLSFSAIAGAPVKFECLQYLTADQDVCTEIGTNAPNANFAYVTDPDAGQDVLHEIVQPTGGSYPTLDMDGESGTTGDSMKTDEIFGISKCTGEIFVQEAANLLLKFTVKKKFDLCVTACDDPAFFGLNPDQKLCAAPPSSAQTNCDVSCPANSVCYRIYVTDVNDPPEWFTLPENSPKCQKTWEGEECIADCCGLVNEKTDDAFIHLSLAPQRGRDSLHPTSTQFPAWADDDKLDRGFKDLVYDSDGDDLTYSTICQNCPGVGRIVLLFSFFFYVLFFDGS
jgi:hypothetical protein